MAFIYMRESNVTHQVLVRQRAISNPFNRPHGFKENKKYHLGDLPNLIIPESGHLIQTVWLNDGLTHRGLTNISGRTIVIHDGPDDYTSQPSGNGGKKLHG